jgi:hypothetical protein
LVWGSGLVAGGGWVRCCGASGYSLIGCWVRDASRRLRRRAAFNGIGPG